MDLQLTKDQMLVQKMVRRFAEEEIDPVAEDLDETEEFPSEIVEKMGALGLMGLPFPHEYGGAGADSVSYAIVIEELSRSYTAIGTIVAAHTSLCAWPIFEFGTEKQKEKYLVPLAKGEHLGAFGLTEPNAGSDAGAQETKAVDIGDHWLINGSKVFITNGGYADTYVIFAMTDKSRKTRGISAFIIEKGDKGFTIGKREEKLGIRASSTTELVFQDCRIPKDRLLGNVGEGFKVAMATLEGGRIGIAAQAVGVAQGAFDLTVEYMKQRKQFGQKLSQFQALAFEMAEMATKIKAARLLVYEAADLKERHLPHALNSAMAKYYAAETAMHVATKGIQFHGGYGFIKDYAIERYFRDAKITEIYEGTSEVQKLIISASIFK
jgi:butyryl-CoA dehydrogenase